MVVEWLKLLILLGFGLVLVVTLLCALLAYGVTRPPRLTAGVAAAHNMWLDPADAGLEYDEWELDRPDGVRLPVWEVHNPDAPDGPVVIVTHSWGTSRLAALERLPFVLPQASKVVLWDLRGHGEAVGGPCALGTAEVDDLLDLIDRVAPERPVILYGFSMGAGISMGAAADHPRVIGVIADGPYRWTGEPVKSILRLNAMPLWPIVPIVHRYLCLRIKNLRAADRARWAARVRCPMLLLHGTDDPVCPIRSALELAEAAPNAELVVMPNAAHLDLHTADPERYAKTIEAFIRRCRRGRHDGRIRAAGEPSAGAPKS